MKYKFQIGASVIGIFAGLLLGVGVQVHAASLTSTQIQAVVGLLESFNVDSATINYVTMSLGGTSLSPASTPDSTPVSVGGCGILTQNLSLGSRDSSNNGEVSVLQRMLGVSQTGYFGVMTQEKLANFQADQNIPAVGVLGPITRRALTRWCGTTVSPTPAPVSSPTPTPTPSPVSVVPVGKIAYTVHKSDGTNDLYLMNSDGTAPAKLISCLATECYPTWSPDGKKLLFQRAEGGSAIYVINADGTNMQRLSQTPAQDVRPSWSPDGSKVVFTHVVTLPTNDGGIPNTDIDVMNVDGSNVQTILASRGTFNVEPRWSPDGSKILLMRGMNGVSQQIYTMNPDGTHLTQLSFLGANGDPFWAPDGSRISFGSNREGGGKLNIYTMKSDGSDVRQITHFSPPDEAGDTSWSPDGTKIVFEVDQGGSGQSNPNVPAEVWIVNTDGTAAISTHQACASVGCSPRWQPITK